tara:strand:- start:178 stop:309 length:132 start_codon:yes stop_codon:yes gene_type:complete
VSSVIFKYPILKQEKGVFLIGHSQYLIDKGILKMDEDAVKGYD